MNSLQVQGVLNTARVPDEPAIQAEPAGQPAHLQEIERWVKARGHHNAYFSAGSKERQVLIVNLPGAHRYVGISLYVYFERETLFLSAHFARDGVPLAGTEQLARTFQLIDERVTVAKNREKKREKIRRLKERSIETQVEELARRLHFSYVLERMHTKVKLTVRIDEHDGLLLDVPFHNVQEPLEGLEALLGAVREIYKTGMRFKLVSTAHIRRWQRPGEADGDPDDEEE